MTLKKQVTRFLLCTLVGAFTLVISYCLGANKTIVSFIGGAWALMLIYMKVFMINCPECKESLGFYDFIRIEFCPKCGKRIKEEKP